MKNRLARFARKASRTRSLPRETRCRIRGEIIAHLEESAERHRERGLGRRQAELRAIRDFGDARKLRIDLGRAWRGRKVVLFPEGAGEHFSSLLIYNLRAVLLIVAIVVLLRWQVVAAYHIPTDSMEPTLHGDPSHGDKIIVNKLYFRMHAPQRWQVAVFDLPGHDQSLIKRIVGLPGEDVDVRDGDLYIDGRIARKPGPVQEDLLVPVYRDGRDLAAEIWGSIRGGIHAWKPGEGNVGVWEEEDGAFLCHADPKGPASLEYARPVLAVFPGGPAREDAETVGDLVLRLLVTPEATCDIVGLELREGGDRFVVEIPVGDQGVTVLRRKNEKRKEIQARSRALFLRPGEERRLSLSNIDNRIILRADGEEVLSLEVDDPDPDGEGGVSGAKFGFRGGAATFREVTLLRDIQYRGEPGLPARVPEGRYFMLGDNPPNSEDSRDWGTVSRGNLIGRPVVVFWPLSRLKVVR